MNTKKLAALMNQKESDVAAFLECVKVWIDKGYSFEDAIKMHMQQMTKIVNQSANIANSNKVRESAADLFFQPSVFN
ncbi:MAG: hypothetical protein KBC53_00040 [Nitrosomonas sp.]|nr:hypothetical protein [Nitrosomonas sp.]